MKQFSKFILVVATAGAALAAQTAPSKVAPDLTTSMMGMADVIVQFAANPTAAQVSQVTAMSPQLGGTPPKQFNGVHAIHLTVPGLAIKTIAGLPFVKYVSPNRPNQRMLDITDATVNASVAWNAGLNGAGVGVAVIDSGIYAHDDLKNAAGVSRIVYSQSFVNGLDASDQYGHGTHVAGIIGSSGHDSTGAGFTRTYAGLAPSVNLINLRVLDANGAGTDANVIAAIDQAIALKNIYNIRIINLSLGRPVYESYTLDPLCQEVESAWKAGIVVVAAAGNYGRENGKHTHGYGTIVSPGNDPYVITVGAMNAKGTKWRSDDILASYSSKGPTAYDHIVKPDIVAPGNTVTSLMAPGSTLATNYPQLLVNVSTYDPGVGGKSTTYFQLSGTSMATPVVSGAAALLIQQNPSLTPDQVKARLMKTAQKALNIYTTAIDAFTFMQFQNQSDILAVGAGYLDIQAALASTDLVPYPALSPTIVFLSHKTVGLVNTQSVTWGDTVVWGADDSVVWGDTVIYGSFVLNGVLNSQPLLALDDSVVWGDDTMDGWSVVWGDSALTATSIVGLASNDDDQ